MRIASAIVAGLFLAAFAAGAYVRNGEDVATGLGAATGTLIFALGAATLIRAAYVRWGNRAARVRSHWLLWIAVGLLFVSTSGQIARENERDPTGLTR